VFICDDCTCEHEFAFSGSYGPCEMCGVTKKCNDIHNYCIKKSCNKVGEKKKEVEDIQ